MQFNPVIEDTANPLMVEAARSNVVNTCMLESKIWLMLTVEKNWQVHKTRLKPVHLSLHRVESSNLPANCLTLDKEMDCVCQ